MKKTGEIVSKRREDGSQYRLMFIAMLIPILCRFPFRHSTQGYRGCYHEKGKMAKSL
jgi:hypothetical protein